MTGSSTIVDTQALPPCSQLALPAPPPATSAEPPVSHAPPAVSPQPPAVAAFSQLTGAQLHSHALPPPPAGAVAAAPYQPAQQVQLPGNQLVQPGPVLSVVAYDAALGTFLDPRSGLATKIKGGLTLASLAKTSNKFSPY